MHILVINCGSSSLKYQLIETKAQQVLAKGLVERIDLGEGTITHSYYNKGEEKKIKENRVFADHQEAFDKVAQMLMEGEGAVIRSKKDIHAIGHRVVHGGSHYVNTQIVTPAMEKELVKIIPLAPLHNPGSITGISAAQKIFPDCIQYTVFDTGFHKTLSPEAYRYAIPEKYYSEEHIRKYGFHGISFQYVYGQVEKHFGKKVKAIIMHLGNGASVAAINEKGESVDTSMGFGPLAGLIMGTRSGDLDPTVVFYMMDTMKMSGQEVSDTLSKKSGMLGIAGSNDARDVGTAYHKGDEKAILCYDMYVYRLKKYLGAYFASLNGADCIVFTAGLGEHDKLLRELTCKNMDFFNLKLDKDKNENLNSPKKVVEIQAQGSLPILIIPTNEELQIALEGEKLLTK